MAAVCALSFIWIQLIAQRDGFGGLPASGMYSAGAGSPYDVMMRPPQAPIDGRPPAPVNPPLVDVMAEELSKPLRALADGRPYRLYRRDLPPDHAARRVGNLGDAMVLTESNELVMDE